MEITLRKATMEDLPRMEEIEAGAIKNLKYLADVIDYYLNESEGDLTCAFIDGVMAGIGKLTVLFDGSAWLETLRVDPAYQGRGVGKAIYRRYFEECAERGCAAARMYTGITNDVSAGLARKNGLETVYTGRGMHLVPDTGLTGDGGFIQVTDPVRAVELLSPLEEKYGGFMVYNRTFYKMNAPLYHALATLGAVFEHPESGSVLTAWARFQPWLALHIGVLEGDRARGAAFVAHLARARGAAKVSTLFAANYADLEADLKRLGFTGDPSDFIAMERVF